MIPRVPSSTAAPRAVAFFTDARAWPGGAEMYLTGLVRWLRLEGWSVRLFTSDRPATVEWVRLLRAEGVPVGLFRPTREVDPRGTAEAARLLSGSSLVHFNKTDPRTVLPAIPGARRAGARVVVTTEHIAKPPESRYPMGAKVVTALVRRANRLVDRVIVVSESSGAAYVTNYRCPPSKIVTVRNGVDLARFRDLPDRARSRAALGLSPGDAVATVVGRLCAGKGQAAAIDAAASAAGRVPGLRLLLVGDGPTAAELRSKAASLADPATVVFAGFRSDIEAVLAATDVLVLSSEAESLPLSVLEAMAAGLPVVSTDVGGVSEAVVDGLTGRLVRPDDPRALADALVEVLGRPDRGAAMGRAGRARAEAEFGVEACYTKVAGLYSELLSAAEGRRA